MLDKTTNSSRQSDSKKEECSMVREKIAKQAGCIIEPYFTNIKGIGGGMVSVMGRTTVII